MDAAAVPEEEGEPVACDDTVALGKTDITPVTVPVFVNVNVCPPVAVMVVLLNPDDVAVLDGVFWVRIPDAVILLTTKPVEDEAVMREVMTDTVPLPMLTVLALPGAGKGGGVLVLVRVMTETPPPGRVTVDGDRNSDPESVPEVVKLGDVEEPLVTPPDADVDVDADADVDADL